MDWGVISVCYGISLRAIILNVSLTVFFSACCIGRNAFVVRGVAFGGIGSR